MSVQFGLWDFDHRSVAPKDIADIRSTLASYASEGILEYSANGVQLLYLPFHVTPLSDLEKQPFLSTSGQVCLWDGRLDNRQELIGLLGAELRRDLTDVAIAAAALEAWGTSALAKLIGDWALSLWNPKERSVLLAKDFLGAKSLYYTVRENSFAWSTLIDPLLLPKNRPFCLQEEYLAGWLSHFPGTHLTPFVGIHSVPPASYVLFRPKNATVRQYWKFDPHKRIRYRDDGQYQEHFRTVFGESVRRRLCSKTAVLADLSGGMDSSSIVCMADALMAGGFEETPRLDTISYYDDSEPNWDEAPFFEKVELQRGRPGHHVALNFRLHWHPAFDPHVFAATPASGINLSEHAEYESELRSGRYRVLLQGIGGDETMGGVPTPMPELADLLAAGRMLAFLHQLMSWAMAQKIPALHLLTGVLREFLPTCFSHDLPARPTWLRAPFERRNRRALNAYPRRFSFFGSLPSFQANMVALDSLRRQIACLGLSPQFPVERRYPYLDRDLLEFLYAVPREQLVRPHQRRSLMRRSLLGIVPTEILNRRRKAFIARAPLTSLQAELLPLLERTKNMTAECAGIVDGSAFRKSLREAVDGGELPIVPALRTLLVEAWLSHLESWNGHSLSTLHAFGSRPFSANVSQGIRNISSAGENPTGRR
jgi:asparagine synthase (glutamine-hydrolysing)